MPGKYYRKKYSVVYVQKSFLFNFKLNGICFNEAIEKLILDFRIVDNYIFNKLVKSFLKDEYEPKKVQSQITNMFVYELETLNID